jgi:opacity protein-like surface antigen
MKNKSLKSLMILLCASLNFTAVMAQGAYFTLGAGYNLPTSTQTLDALSFSDEIMTENTTTYKQNYVSLGKGLSVGGAFGYMFNENIGAELGISYLMGSTWESKMAYNDFTTSLTSTNEISSKMTRINPQFVISMEANKLTPYAKVGLLLGMGSMSLNSKVEYLDGVIEQTTIFNGGVATGFTTTIGASYAINDKISLFGDLNMVNMSYSPTKGIMSKYAENGVDLLSLMDPIEKEIQFVDTYVEDDNIQPSITEPSKALKIKFPFSSVGVHIGLKYTL